MDKKAVYGLIGIAALEFIAIVTLAIQINTQRISPNALSLTQPVFFFSGTVKKVSDKMIVVEQNTVNEPAVFLDKTSKITPTPLKVPSFEFVIDKSTVFSRQLSPVVSLFNANFANQSQPSVKDVKVGIQVTVRTESDLRTISGIRTKASIVTLPAINNYVQGVVVNSTDKTVLVHAVAQINGQQGDYLFNITPDTEISNYVQETVDGVYRPKPQKYAVSVLKPQMRISVWTNENIIAGKTYSAVRIEPIVFSATLPTDSNSSSPPISKPVNFPTTSTDEIVLPTPKTVVSPGTISPVKAKP